MVRSYKIRLLPTKEQEELFWKHANACRFIWNWGLGYQQEQHKSGKEHLSGFSMINLLSPLKKKESYIWLKEVSADSLNTIMLDLDKSYKSFFRKENRFPKFKSKKKVVPSFPVCHNRFYFIDNFVQIQKVGKVKFKTNYNIPVAKYINPRIKLVNDKWILSFVVECENQARELTDRPMGIDLGVKDLATVAYGDECFVFHNINKSKHMKVLNHKLKHLQRKVSRKYHTNSSWEKTNNILKVEKQIKELQYHISCIRQNYIHQTTHKLIELLPNRIVMEDLNISGMMKK